MLDRLNDAAERLATNVSRRHFLGSLGRWAAATALAMAGVLSTTGTARAGKPVTCCLYYFGQFPPFCCGAVCVPLGASCPGLPSTCPSNAYLGSSATVKNCGSCKC